MNILLLVNQFCKHNDFFPTTLYGTKNKITIDIIRDNSLIIPEYIIDILN